MSMIEKKKERHNKVALLAKLKLDNIEVLITLDLINQDISHDKLISVNDVLKEYNEIKEANKTLRGLIVIVHKYRWYRQRNGI